MWIGSDKGETRTYLPNSFSPIGAKIHSCRPPSRFILRESEPDFTVVANSLTDYWDPVLRVSCCCYCISNSSFIQNYLYINVISHHCFIFFWYFSYSIKADLVLAKACSTLFFKLSSRIREFYLIFRSSGILFILIFYGVCLF